MINFGLVHYKTVVYNFDVKKLQSQIANGTFSVISHGNLIKIKPLNFNFKSNQHPWFI